MTNTIRIESTASTAVLLFPTIAARQAAGGVCAIVDLAGVTAGDAMAELAAAGVDLADLLVSCPETATQAAEIADTLIRTGAIDLLVVFGLPTRRRRALRELASKVSTVVVYVDGGAS